MKSKQSFRLLILLVFGMTVMAFTPQKSIQLRYNFNQGEKYKLEIKTTQNISMSVGGQTMVMKQNIILNQTSEILSGSNDENIELEFSYDRVRFDQSGLGMEIKWDSDQPESAQDNMMVQQIAAQFKKSLAEKVNSTIDKFGNPIQSTSSGGMGNTNVSGVEMGMLVVFPEHNISVGQSWDVSTKPDPGSDFTINSTYTLTSVKGSKAFISYEGTLSGTEMDGEKAKLSGTISGKAEVNTKTGWLESATTMQNMEMEMEQQGQVIPMSLNSVIELKSK